MARRAGARSSPGPAATTQAPADALWQAPASTDALHNGPEPHESAPDDTEAAMAPLRVHEFTSMDGIIDTPTWTFDFGFDPKMGDAIAGAMGGCTGILLGRTTYEMFEPAWSARRVEDDPGAPFMNDTTKYVVSSTLTDPTWRKT